MDEMDNLFKCSFTAYLISTLSGKIVFNKLTLYDESEHYSSYEICGSKTAKSLFVKYDSFHSECIFVQKVGSNSVPSGG